MNGALWFLEGAMTFLPRWLINIFVNVLFALAILGTGRVQSLCARNFQIVYGPLKSAGEYRRMARQYLKNIGHSMVDLLYYVERPKALGRITRVEHEERLQEALRQGKGVIGVTAHLGNFPLMFVSLVQRGYKVNVIIRPMRDAAFSSFIHHQCRKWGINMIHTVPKQAFFKECLGVLKRNELLFILLDEIVPKDNGVPVQFFNRTVTRAIGPMLFHQRTGSPIVPIFIVRDEEQNFRITVEDELQVATGGNADENTHTNIARLTAVIERHVAKYPLQWGGWLNKRWSET